MARSYSAGETRKAQELRQMAQSESERAARLRADAEASTRDEMRLREQAAAEDARENRLVEKYKAKLPEFNKTAENAKEFYQENGLIDKEIEKEHEAELLKYINGRGDEFMAEFRKYDSESNALQKSTGGQPKSLYRNLVGFMESKGYSPDGSKLDAIDKAKANLKPAIDAFKKAGKEGLEVLKEYMPDRSDYNLFSEKDRPYSSSSGMDRVIDELKSAPDVVKAAARAYLASKLLEQTIKYNEVETYAYAYRDSQPGVNRSRGYQTEKQRDRNNFNARDKQTENLRRIEGYIRSLGFPA